jgi:hypothetical protein
VGQDALQDSQTKHRYCRAVLKAVVLDANRQRIPCNEMPYQQFELDAELLREDVFSIMQRNRSAYTITTRLTHTYGWYRDKRLPQS